MRRTHLLLPLIASALYAQPTVAPTTESTGTVRGTDVGGYNFTQSFEVGYRWHLVGGNGGMYRSVDNFGNGLRVLGSNLTVNSKDGHGRYFDEILLNTFGLGNDPYQAAVLRIQKNNLYRYDMTWRLNDYFNPGLTVAAGTHLEDTLRRLQDHDLTLLPQSRIHFRIGYSRNTEDGPALTTSQEFTTTGSGLPVFTDVRRQWNEYRVGADVNLAGFQFTLTHRWDYFKDDSPVSLAGVVGAGTAADNSVLRQFNRSQPVHGANPGWLGNLFTRRKYWGANARMTYVSGNRDFALVESAIGTGQFGGAANRQILVGGTARRPVAAGELTLHFFLTERLTLVNSTSAANNRIDGLSHYTELLNGSGFVNLDFRYLAIRTIANTTDVNYRLSSWLGVYAGYYYSDRQIRTVEASMIPDVDKVFTSQMYAVSNHLNTGRLGVRWRPVKPFTVNVDGEVGRANNPLTSIADRKYHSINGRAEYRTSKLQFTGGYRQVYNNNAPVTYLAFNSHSRQYSGSASWAPKGWFSLDASWSKLHLDTDSFLTFFASTTVRPQQQTAVPEFYRSNIHAANLTARFEIRRRANFFAGYSITKDTGDGRTSSSDPIRSLLDSVQTFPLTYQSPLARLSIRISPKLRWNAGWQYYGYNEDFHLFGFNQNYHAHTGYTSVLWSF